MICTICDELIRWKRQGDPALEEFEDHRERCPPKQLPFGRKPVERPEQEEETNDG